VGLFRRKWIGHKFSTDKDRAIEMLPHLDSDLAARTLFTDAFFAGAIWLLSLYAAKHVDVLKPLIPSGRG